MLSEDEKKVVDRLKLLSKLYLNDCNLINSNDLKIGLNIINRLQKENKECEYTHQQIINNITKLEKENKQLKEQIKNLEKGIKRLKKKNEKLFEKSIEETVIATTERLKEFYIHKQIIKNKIEELRNNIKNQNCIFPHIVEHKIDVLKDLLEESEGK